MQNKKIVVLIALVAFLVGLVGMIICVTPGQTAPDRLVAKYVKAINAGNIEKIRKMGMASVVSDAMGSQLGGLLGSVQDGLSGDAFDKDQQAPTDKIYNALKKSAFSVTGELPEDFKEIKSVKVVGCVDGERESYMGLTGMNVGVVLEITFVDAEGETQSVCCAENIGVIRYKNKNYIAG